MSKPIDEVFQLFWPSLSCVYVISITISIVSLIMQINVSLIVHIVHYLSLAKWRWFWSGKFEIWSVKSQWILFSIICGNPVILIHNFRTKAEYCLLSQCPEAWELLYFPFILMNRHNKTESVIFKLCRFSISWLWCTILNACVGHLWIQHPLQFQCLPQATLDFNCLHVFRAWGQIFFISWFTNPPTVIFWKVGIK